MVYSRGLLLLLYFMLLSLLLILFAHRKNGHCVIMIYRYHCLTKLIVISLFYCINHLMLALNRPDC